MSGVSRTRVTIELSKSRVVGVLNIRSHFGGRSPAADDKVVRKLSCCVLWQDLANKLWNVCEMLPMALESNEEYPITFWWPFASGGR
jgi:hypothetical protein